MNEKIDMNFITFEQRRNETKRKNNSIIWTIGKELSLTWLVRTKAITCNVRHSTSLNFIVQYVSVISTMITPRKYKRSQNSSRQLSVELRLLLVWSWKKNATIWSIWDLPKLFVSNSMGNLFVGLINMHLWCEEKDRTMMMMCNWNVQSLTTEKKRRERREKEWWMRCIDEVKVKGRESDSPSSLVFSLFSYALSLFRLLWMNEKNQYTWNL